MAAFGNGKLVPPARVLTNDLSETLENRLHRQITEQILREAQDRGEGRCGAAGDGPARAGGAVQPVVQLLSLDQPAASWRAAIERVADQLLASQDYADPSPEIGPTQRWTPKPSPAPRGGRRRDRPASQ